MAEPVSLLITGSSGFIGSHLLRMAREQHPDWEVVRLDIEDADDVRNCDAPLLQAFDYVVHLAAISDTRTSGKELFDVNVMGAVALCEALADSPKLKRLVYVSSIQRAEDSLYGASKQCAEIVLQGYAARGLEASTVQLCNVYGPGQTGRLIPNCIEAILAGYDAPIDGHKNDQRTFLYVDDACRIILEVLTGDAYSPVETTSKTVGEVATDIYRLIHHPSTDEHGSSTPWEAGLHATIQWHRERRAENTVLSA